jgi:hypothetical protein
MPFLRIVVQHGVVLWRRKGEDRTAGNFRRAKCLGAGTFSIASRLLNLVTYRYSGWIQTMRNTEDFRIVSCEDEQHQ